MLNDPDGLEQELTSREAQDLVRQEMFESARRKMGELMNARVFTHNDIIKLAKRAVMATRVDTPDVDQMLSNLSTLMIESVDEMREQMAERSPQQRALELAQTQNKHVISPQWMKPSTPNSKYAAIGRCAACGALVIIGLDGGLSGRAIDELCPGSLAH